MTATIRGHYRQTFPGRSPAPFLTATVTFDDNDQEADFLIDTGAEITVLFPHDAARLFGSETYARLGRLFSGNVVPISGVGANAAVELEMAIALPVSDGQPVVFRQPIVVMPAPTEPQTLRQADGLASLLGRDILNHFILMLNPSTAAVELTELDAAPA